MTLRIQNHFEPQWVLRKSPDADDRESTSVRPCARTLASLVNYIRRDAIEDTSHYLVRSNTSHDGE